jgi:hypothetical protein
MQKSDAIAIGEGCFSIRIAYFESIMNKRTFNKFSLILSERVGMNL